MKLIRKETLVVPILLLALTIPSGCKSTTDNRRSVPQSGIMTFNAGPGFDDREIKVHYYIPAGKVSEMTCQVVMHGAGRNADDYLAGWKSKADEYGLIIIAPGFSGELFRSEEYYGGRAVTAEGELNEPALTIFSLIDRIFELVKETYKLKQTSYNIYGHSAGGQFTHRFMLFYDSPYVDRAVAANAGWYTFPDDTIDYPYGLRGLYPDTDKLREKYYARKLTILLGTADTIRGKDLRQTEEADLQGLTRLARGETFFNYNKSIADRLGLAFEWSKVYVPGVGHDHTRMSPAAADLLYGSRITEKDDILEGPHEDKQ
jgi:predicted esterase